MAGRERRPRQSTESTVSLGGIVTQESLPLPYVHHPNHYGTFFAFSEAPSAPAHLCACAEGAVQNLVRLKEAVPQPGNSNPLVMAPLSSREFPDVIARASLEGPDSPLRTVRFGERLCHRCNLCAPSLYYCHEMYGGAFVQTYGWYINQTWLRLGLLPSLRFGWDVQDMRLCLDDVCPDDLQELVERWRRANREYKQEYARLTDLAHGLDRTDIPDNEVTYWHNVRNSDAELMVVLRRKASHLMNELKNRIENITREEFGFRKVGEGWVSETMLYNVLRRLFPNEAVLRHHRADWLEGLELDVYLPDRRLAIEYQGQQHFHPIKAWGGKRALTALRERDRRKAEICRMVGVELVTVDYTEPIAESHLRTLLRQHGHG